METNIYLKVKPLEKPFGLRCHGLSLKLDLGFAPGLAFQNWVSRNILLTTVLSKGISTEGLVVIML